MIARLALILNLRRAWLMAVLLLYLALAGWQLGLPGLHYDEAKEAGQNAMELLTGAPVAAFRGAGVFWFGRTLPLMVQDYIGALNVYLAVPLLALTGVGVPNLRVLPIVTGLIALLLLERALSEWWAYGNGRDGRPLRAEDKAATPISLAGLFAVSLLAVSPSYIFWARQGVFVTNLMLPFVFLCLWQGVRWLRTGRPVALIVAALAGGAALYAKLSAYWVIVPFVLLTGGWWLWQRRVRPRPAPNASTVTAPALTLRTLAVTAAAFVLPLLPLLVFNWQTGGTLASIAGNLGYSYYGVENTNILGNLPVRGRQVLQVLRGEQFWYLGAVHANGLAPWLFALLAAAGVWCSWRRMLPPLLLAVAVFAASLFTVSDLFVTHYVLLQPLLLGIGGLALACIGEDGLPHRLQHEDGAGWTHLQRGAVVAVLLLWVALDLTATVRYHQALANTGGLADHSDASYHLAYHLRYNGIGAPIALDWGMDAPVRYLTNGAVTPLEIFGYASLESPDPNFAARLEPHLGNPDSRFLLHAPGATVFKGRREALLQIVQAQGGQAVMEQQFAQRDGTPLYEIWRIQSPQ